MPVSACQSTRGRSLALGRTFDVTTAWRVALVMRCAVAVEGRAVSECRAVTQTELAVVGRPRCEAMPSDRGALGRGDGVEAACRGAEWNAGSSDMTSHGLGDCNLCGNCGARAPRRAIIPVAMAPFPFANIGDIRHARKEAELRMSGSVSKTRAYFRPCKQDIGRKWGVFQD